MFRKERQKEKLSGNEVDPGFMGPEVHTIWGALFWKNIELPKHKVQDLAKDLNK